MYAVVLNEINKGLFYNCQRTFCGELKKTQRKAVKSIIKFDIPHMGFQVMKLAFSLSAVINFPCSLNSYQLMLKCWTYELHKRMSFQYIVSCLEHLKSSPQGSQCALVHCGVGDISQGFVNQAFEGKCTMPGLKNRWHCNP